MTRYDQEGVAAPGKEEQPACAYDLQFRITIRQFSFKAKYLKPYTPKKL